MKILVANDLKISIKLLLVKHDQLENAVIWPKLNQFLWFKYLNIRHEILQLPHARINGCALRVRTAHAIQIACSSSMAYAYFGY